MNTWREEFQHEASLRGWLQPLTRLTRRKSATAGPNAVASAETEWTEEEVVLLHWRLLERIRVLQDAKTPLEERIELLQWIFTDAKHDREPFSFVSCVEVVSLSPLSPAPCFFGVVDAEELRDWVRLQLKRWFKEAFSSYPTWVCHAIIERPGWIAMQLARNPQWINEQLRKSQVQGDLFT